MRFMFVNLIAIWNSTRFHQDHGPNMESKYKDLGSKVICIDMLMDEG